MSSANDMWKGTTMTTATNRMTRVILMILTGAPLACVSPADLDEVEQDFMALEDDSDEGSAPGDDEARAEDGIRPFHVAAFDHEPSEEEIQGEFRQFLESSEGIAVIKAMEDQGNAPRVQPTGWLSPAPGQKLVRLDAVTSNIEDAGTDGGDHINFFGVWRANNTNSTYTEAFLLDKPNYDDLERNTTDVFYYLLNFSNYAYNGTSDRFVRGRIGTTSSDGWHCHHLNVTDQNYLGQQRQQVLPFNQWVDYPSPKFTSWMYGNNLTQWLSYY